jgi:hypothetical protein
MATLSVAALRANPLVCDLLGGPFEFIVCNGTSDPVWFTVDGCNDLDPVAEDGSGGVYALVGPKHRVLHVSSEGRAGTIASDLGAAVALVIACPYWRDLIKFSGCHLLRMRRAACDLEEAAREEFVDLDEHRAFLWSELGLCRPADPIGDLHRCLTEPASWVAVLAPDGRQLPGLFAGAG